LPEVANAILVKRTHGVVLVCLLFGVFLIFKINKKTL